MTALWIAVVATLAAAAIIAAVNHVFVHIMVRRRIGRAVYWLAIRIDRDTTTPLSKGQVQLVQDCRLLGIEAAAQRSAAEKREDLSFDRLLRDSSVSVKILAYSAALLRTNMKLLEEKLGGAGFTIDVVLPNPKIADQIKPFGLGTSEYFDSYATIIAMIADLKRNAETRVHLSLTDVIPLFSVTIADDQVAHVQQVGLGIGEKDRLLYRVVGGELIAGYRQVFFDHKDAYGHEIASETDLRSIAAEMREKASSAGSGETIPGGKHS